MIRVGYLRLKAKCNDWKQFFLISRKQAGQNSMENGRISIFYSKNGKQNFKQSKTVQ